jgi:hypothetical protein
MHPFGRQLVRATRCARYANPTFVISARRHFASTAHPSYAESSQSRSPYTGSTSNASDHSAESYVKDVDHSPPADSSTYQVDSSSEAVQRPHKPPSGQYSQTGVQAGVGSAEYKTMDKHAPYDPPSPGGAADKKLRYGGKGQKGGETSRSGDGPEGAGAGGRKPEGK